MHGVFLRTWSESSTVAQKLPAESSPVFRGRIRTATKVAVRSLGISTSITRTVGVKRSVERDSAQRVLAFDRPPPCLLSGIFLGPTIKRLFLRGRGFWFQNQDNITDTGAGARYRASWTGESKHSRVSFRTSISGVPKGSIDLPAFNWGSQKGNRDVFPFLWTKSGHLRLELDFFLVFRVFPHAVGSWVALLSPAVAPGMSFQTPWHRKEPTDFVFRQLFLPCGL